MKYSKLLLSVRIWLSSANLHVPLIKTCLLQTKDLISCDDSTYQDISQKI